MSPLQYHVLWVAVALAAIAVASGLIARWLQRRERRRTFAAEALDALARHSEWVADQRRGLGFGGEPPPARSALAQLLALQRREFPELAQDMLPVMAAHARMLDFLWRQQALRQADMEAWLDSDHDGRFMLLWREHVAAVHGMADRLRAIVGSVAGDAQPEAVFPA